MSVIGKNALMAPSLDLDILGDDLVDADCAAQPGAWALGPRPQQIPVGAVAAVEENRDLAGLVVELQQEVIEHVRILQRNEANVTISCATLQYAYGYLQP